MNWPAYESLKTTYCAGETLLKHTELLFFKDTKYIGMKLGWNVVCKIINIKIYNISIRCNYAAEKSWSLGFDWMLMEYTVCGYWAEKLVSASWEIKKRKCLNYVPIFCFDPLICFSHTPRPAHWFASVASWSSLWIDSFTVEFWVLSTTRL